MPSCCGKNAKYPSAWAQAKSFSYTVASAISHAAKTGEVTASVEEVQKRVEVCGNCDRKRGVRCSECGCYIHLKTAVKVASCPLGKW